MIPAEVVASHPEHWAIYVDKEKGAPCVFETIGDKPAKLYNRVNGKAAAFVDDDPHTPFKNTGRGYLYDDDELHVMEARMTVRRKVIQPVRLLSGDHTSRISLLMMLERNAKILSRSIINLEIMKMVLSRLILQYICLQLLETT